MDCGDGVGMINTCLARIVGAHFVTWSRRLVKGMTALHSG